MNRLLQFARPGAFRLFLAFVVLVGHSCRFDIGATAVYVFFVLSGFWIHRMWTQKYSRTEQPLRVFYSSRLWRIFPAFWLVNGLATIVLVSGLTAEYAGDSGSPTGWLHTWFSNLFLLGYSSLPWALGGLRVAWSLDVELQFYLLFPLLLVLCTRPRWGPAAFAALIVLSTVGLAVFLYPLEEIPRNVWHVGLFFIAGAAASHWDWNPSRQLAAGSALLTVAVVGLCWLSPAGRLLFENDKHGATAYFDFLRRSAQAAVGFLAVPFALKTVRNPSDEWDRRFGELSFVVYLIHWPVMMIHAHYYEHVPPGRRWPSLVVAWITIGVLSWLLYRFFDQPIERWRKRWVAERMPAR